MLAGEQPDGGESKHPERDFERRPARAPRQIGRRPPLPASVIGVTAARAAGEQALRPPDQDDDHDRVDDEGAELRHVIFAGDVADAEQDRGEERPGDARRAADRHHDQKVDHVFEREGRIEAENFRAQRAAEAGKPGAEGEGEREHRADIDAEPARHAPVVDRGAQPAAEAGLGEDATASAIVSRPQITMISSRYLPMPMPKTLNWPCSACGICTNCCERAHHVVDGRHRHEDKPDREQHLIEVAAGVDMHIERALEEGADRRRHHESERQAERKRHAQAIDQDDRAIAAGHGEGAVGEIDEIHQAERDGQAARQHEQQHAVGNSVEQDRQHRRLVIRWSFRKPRKRLSGIA